MKRQVAGLVAFLVGSCLSATVLGQIVVHASSTASYRTEINGQVVAETDESDESFAIVEIDRVGGIDGDNLGTVKANAQAGVGSLAAQVLTTGGAAGFINASGIATASFTDILTFKRTDSSSFPNMLVEGSFKLNGEMFANATGKLKLTPFGFFSDVSAGASVVVTGTGILNPAIGIVAKSFASDPPPSEYLETNISPPEIIPTFIDVIPDFPYVVTYKLEVAASVIIDNFDPTFEPKGDAHGAYGHTLQWGGITSVKDKFTGLPVQGWSVTSESGFDYSQPYPVPEPTSCVLLVGAFVGLA